MGKKGIPAVEKGPRITTYIGQTVFTAVYLLVVYGLKSIDLWNKSFDIAGSQYFIYNLLSIVLLLFYGWIMYYAGHIACRLLRWDGSDSELSAADNFLIYSFIGAAVYSAGMLLLGFLRLYYIGVVVIITAPVVFLSYTRLKGIADNIPASFSAFYRDYFKQEPKLNMVVGMVFMLIAAGQTLYFLISKGLMPDLLTNDTIGHYIPYYQEVIRSHGIMNKYFLHFYYSKGAGLIFLSQLLAGVQSAQMVSFYFFFLGGVMMYAFVKRATSNDFIWMMLAVILYFSSAIFLNESGMMVSEFQKPHLLIGAFICFVVYGTVIAHSLAPDKLRSWRLLQAIILIALILLSPISIAFILPFLLLQWIAAFFIKDKINPAWYVLPMAVTLLVFVGMLLVNYFASGMAEATPLPIFYKLSNADILSKWVSPSAILFQIQMNNISGEGAGAIALANLLKVKNVIANMGSVLYDPSMVPAFIYLALLPLTCLLIMVAVKRKVIDSAIIPLIVSIVSMLLVSFILLVVTEQLSIYRYTTFLVVVRDFLYVYILFFVTKHFAGRFYKKLVVVPVIIIIFYSCSNFYAYAKQESVSNEEKIDFLTGNKSYADFYEKRWGAVKMGLTIQQKIGSDKKVVVMNFLPSLYGIPGSGFERPLMNDYNTKGNFEEILFGAPEQAMRTLQALNINYFLFVFDKPFLPTAYAPLFEPENVRKYFTRVLDGQNLILLTWKSPSDPELPDDIIKGYNNLREAGRSYFYAKSYYSVKSILHK